MRYNKRFIKARFEMAMEVLGVPHGKPYDKNGNAIVGVYFLDSAYIYGGYRIQRMSTPTGGESMPFGQERHSAREFSSLLDGIIYTVPIVRFQDVKEDA